MSDRLQPPIAPAFRTLPHNVEAEKALLGAIFANNRVFEAVSEFLRAEHFALRQNGRIFASCAKLILQEGKTADPITLKGLFEQDETLNEIGGPAYLVELAASAVGIINAVEYARLVYDLHLKRELIGIGEWLTEEAYRADVGEEAASIQEAAEARLFALASRAGDDRGGAKPIAHYVDVGLKTAEAAFKSKAPAGIPTGFADLDGIIGGLHATDLVILAGRPSMGKTALAMNIAFNVAAIPGIEPVLCFELEMSGEQLTMREIAGRAGISTHRVRLGRIGAADFEQMIALSRDVRALPIYIDERPALPLSSLRTTARRLKRTHGLSLIIVDYLQLVTPAVDRRRGGDTRTQEVSDITQGLKALAKDLGIPVIAVSQLSRAVEARENKRPLLSDLRESGSIEQDADVVGFIYRDQYYIERDRPERKNDESDDRFGVRLARWESRLEKCRNVAEAIVAKQRHGPIGTANLRFDPETARFTNLRQTNLDQTPF